MYLFGGFLWSVKEFDLGIRPPLPLLHVYFLSPTLQRSIGQCGREHINQYFTSQWSIQITRTALAQYDYFLTCQATPGADWFPW